MLRETLKKFASKRNKITNLAECLLHEYESERFRMMRNPMMYAAVFLDRRYAADLKSGELELAKMSLCNMWDRVQKHQNVENTGTENEDEDEDDSFDLDQYMLSKTSNVSAPTVSNLTSNVSNPNYMMSKTDFLLTLGEYETKYPTISTKYKIIDFIEENKYQFPEIYIVANIVFGIPPSQTSVERTFSHFSFVYNHLRNSLNPTLLESILLIRLNKEIVNKIFKEELSILDAD